MRVGQPGVARPAWYDRNPATRIDAQDITAIENTVETQMFLRTIPSGKKALLISVWLWMLARVAATTTTSAHRVHVRFLLRNTGSINVVVAKVALHSDSYVAGDHRAEVMPGGGIIPSGDQIEASYIFQGNAAGVGVIDLAAYAAVTEYDA